MSSDSAPRGRWLGMLVIAVSMIGGTLGLFFMDPPRVGPPVKIQPDPIKPGALPSLAQAQQHMRRFDQAQREWYERYGNYARKPELLVNRPGYQSLAQPLLDCRVQLEVEEDGQSYLAGCRTAQTLVVIGRSPSGQLVEEQRPLR